MKRHVGYDCAPVDHRAATHAPSGGLGRARGRVLGREARGWLIGALWLPPTFGACLGFLSLMALHDVGALPPLRFYIPISAMIVCATLGFLAISLLLRDRGQRAKTGHSRLIYGRRFNVFAVDANSVPGQKEQRRLSRHAGRAVPLLLFALIGPTPDAARWYRIPSDWNDVISPSDEQVTLETQPYTDFVIRLNDLDQRDALEALADASRAAREQLSREERAALKRARRRAFSGWGVSPAEARAALRIYPLIWALSAFCLAFGLAYVMYADWIVYRLMALAFALLSR